MVFGSVYFSDHRLCKNLFMSIITDVAYVVYVKFSTNNLWYWNKRNYFNCQYWYYMLLFCFILEDSIEFLICLNIKIIPIWIKRTGFNRFNLTFEWWKTYTQLYHDPKTQLVVIHTDIGQVVKSWFHWKISLIERIFFQAKNENFANCSKVLWDAGHQCHKSIGI